MDNQTLQGAKHLTGAKRASLQSIQPYIAGSWGTEVEALYGEMSSLFGTVRSPRVTWPGSAGGETQSDQNG